MPSLFAIASSDRPEPQEAAHQAAIAIKNKLNRVDIDLCIIFTTAAYTGPEILNAIHSVLRIKKLIGSSTAGILIPEGVFTSGIGILAIISDEMAFSIALNKPAVGADMRASGYDWARRLESELHFPHHQSCVMLADPTICQDATFTRGAQEVLGLSVPFIGAASADNFKNKHLTQFYQKQTVSNSAVGLLIGGGGALVGYRHDFKPLGKPRTVTKASPGVIHTIDNKPALHIYSDYLGLDAEQIKQGPFNPFSMIYPLGIYLESHNHYLLKNAVDILPDGSIVTQGEIPEKSEVHLMIGSRDACKDSCLRAARHVKETLSGKQAKCVLVFASASRLKILKNKAAIESLIIKDELGYSTPIFGMYGYGEIAPLSADQGINSTYMQNESIVLMAIY